MRFGFTHLLGITFLAFFSGSFAPAKGKGNMFVGGGVAQQSDDRTQPALMFQTGRSDWNLRGYYYGQEFGPVTQRTYILSIVRAWPVKLGIFENLMLSLGPTFMQEATLLEVTGQPTEREGANNVGMSVSLTWERNLGPLAFFASWDSLLFPAGSGAIFLVTGRKQLLTLGIGRSW